MSALDINNVKNDKEENEEENKSPDKKQIEAEEKEVMLKVDIEDPEMAAEIKGDNEGPVKAALSGNVTEEGREVKPKFIPIGAIKMPGFFTRNSDKDKSKEEDGGIEKEGDNEKADESKPKRRRFQFLHTCPFTQFLHKTHDENDDGNTEQKRGIFSLQYPKMFQKRSEKDPEATLASMETLEDKLDTPNDGMENVKLDTEEEGKVATKLPLKERIRQKKFIIDDIIVVCLALLVLLAVIIGISIVATAGPPRERPLRLGRYMTTITSCGKVEGVLDEGVYHFYGIPYAVPPVGERRFTYAEPLNLSTCWNDTLDAHQRGPLCMQLIDKDKIIGEEDCLNLDVVTPHVRYDSPLPVVVIIASVSLGGGITPAQPSALYARTKEVVFVRPNFRLGPFGFLALDILANTKYPATAGNYALSDLVAALQWVHYNIKHFGGDPQSVTLLGHQSGATLTAALTTVVQAQKLYSRTWLSSPSSIFPTEPLKQAFQSNEKYKQTSECQDVDCLRNLPASDVLKVTPSEWLFNQIQLMPGMAKDEPRRSWLVLDGVFLRIPITESWIEQIRMKEDIGKEKLFKPMVLGTTQHCGFANYLRSVRNDWESPAAAVSYVNETLAEGNTQLTTQIFNYYNKTMEGVAELISAIRITCPLFNLTQSILKAPMYLALGTGAYLPPQPVSRTHNANGLQESVGTNRERSAAELGMADINADIEAILGTFDSETPEQRRFMAAMQHLFYYYVWHGHLPGPETSLIAVGQDLLPLQDLAACHFFAEKGLLTKYGHID